MKKLWSILLTLVFVSSSLNFVATAAEPLWNNTLTSLSITADESITNPVTTSEETVLQQWNILLKSANQQVLAKENQPNLSTLKKIATVTGTAENGNKVEYQLYQGNQTLYLAQGKNNMSIVTSEAWNGFTRWISNSFYKYGMIPTPLSNNTPLAVVDSNYVFVKIDNLYYIINLPKEAMSVPVLEVQAGAALPITFPTQPSSVALSVLDGEKTVWEGTVQEFPQFRPPSEGDFTLRVKSNYLNDYYQGTVTTKATLRYNEGFTLTAENPDTYPGEVVVLKAKNLPLNGEILFDSKLDFVPTFFPQENGEYVALMPVSYYTKTGQYPVSITVNGSKKTTTINVQNKQFPVQHLTANPTNAQQTILNQRANEEFEANIKPIRHTVSSTPYWKNSDFVWPVQGGRISTQFGMIRYINGSKEGTRHGALDIAIPRGTRVGATNAGKILYAGNLQLTGNTVVIDHGYGLKSWYYHMDSLTVKTGDVVKATQQIGTVGSTGFSTGPHLHFGLSVNNVFVNPTTILQNDLLKDIL